MLIDDDSTVKGAGSGYSIWINTQVLEFKTLGTGIFIDGNSSAVNVVTQDPTKGLTIKAPSQVSQASLTVVLSSLQRVQTIRHNLLLSVLEMRASQRP